MIGRLALGALALAIAAGGGLRVDKALRVAPNFTAETLTLETSVAGRDPAQAFALIPAKARVSVGFPADSCLPPAAWASGSSSSCLTAL